MAQSTVYVVMMQNNHGPRLIFSIHKNLDLAVAARRKYKDEEDPQNLISMWIEPHDLLGE